MPIYSPPQKKGGWAFDPIHFWKFAKDLLYDGKTSDHVLSEFGHFLRLQGCTLPENDHICPPQRVGAFESMIFPTSPLVGYMYPFPGGFPCIYHDLIWQNWARRVPSQDENAQNGWDASGKSLHLISPDLKDLFMACFTNMSRHEILYVRDDIIKRGMLEIHGIIPPHLRNLLPPQSYNIATLVFPSISGNPSFPPDFPIFPVFPQCICLTSGISMDVGLTFGSQLSFNLHRLLIRCMQEMALETR